MDKKLKNFINKQIINQLNDYENFNINIFTKLFKYIDSFSSNLMFIIYYDNNIYILYPGGDNRKILITEAFKKVITLKKHKIKNTIIPFFISDAYFYHDNNIPILIEAKPENKKGILFPDASNFLIRVSNNTYNYNELLKLFEEKKCMTCEKISKVYFKGANTGASKHNVRKKLEDFSKNNKNYEIEIGSKHIPMFDFCKYKYLLNLPGHQPWSNRFMKVVIMGSLLVNVDLMQSFDGGKTFNGSWITVYHNYFKNKKDYINLTYKWIENKTTDNNVISLYNKINKLYEYFENHNEKYNKIIKSCTNKALQLNLNVYYYTIYRIILQFTEKLYKYNTENDIIQYIKKLLNETNKKNIVILKI
jgi:hypothetical protein